MSNKINNEVLAYYPNHELWWRPGSGDRRSPEGVNGERRDICNTFNNKKLKTNKLCFHTDIKWIKLMRKKIFLTKEFQIVYVDIPSPQRGWAKPLTPEVSAVLNDLFPRDSVQSGEINTTLGKPEQQERRQERWTVTVIKAKFIARTLHMIERGWNFPSVVFFPKPNNITHMKETSNSNRETLYRTPDCPQMVKVIMNRGV